MKKLILAYADCTSWNELRRLALDENLLGKTSEVQINDLLRAFKRRFLCLRSLPSPTLLATFFKAPVSESSKTQVLFPYYLLSDALVERCYRDLVLPRIRSLRPALTIEETIGHLLKLSNSHPELSNWSEYLRRRWARAFLSLLRQFNLMDRHPHTNLRRFWLPPEVFAFYWLWYWQKNKSFRLTRKKSLWHLLQLDETYLENLLLEGQERGWWFFQRSGEIVNFQVEYKNLQEWLNNGLA